MKKAIILIFSGLLFNYGCLKDDCGECYIPPVPFRMQIVDKESGENLITDGVFNKDSIFIYGYDKENEMKSAQIYFYTFQDQLNVLGSNDLPVISSENITKTFYIYLNQNDTDTLYLDVIQSTENCCTYFPYIEVKGNGVDMEFDNIGYTFLLKK